MRWNVNRSFFGRYHTSSTASGSPFTSRGRLGLPLATGKRVHFFRNAGGWDVPTVSSVRKYSVTSPETAHSRNFPHGIGRCVLLVLSLLKGASSPLFITSLAAGQGFPLEGGRLQAAFLLSSECETDEVEKKRSDYPYAQTCCKNICMFPKRGKQSTSPTTSSVQKI